MCKRLLWLNFGCCVQEVLHSIVKSLVFKSNEETWEKKFGLHDDKNEVITILITDGFLGTSA